LHSLAGAWPPGDLAAFRDEFVRRYEERAVPLVEALDEEVGFDSCLIGVRDEDSPDVLTLIGASGRAQDFRGLTIPRRRGLPWAVLESGLPAYVPDLRTEPPVLDWDDRVRSGIYAPLAVRGRAIGVVSAHRHPVGAFTAAELNLLTNVAGYLAGACEVARRCEQHRASAATDPLTGLKNRRAFRDETEIAMDVSRRTGRPLAVAILDLDGFKAVNDVHGHAAGDMALIRVAEALRACARAYDLLVRWGGDEFVLLLPGTTASQAHQILERTPSIAVPACDPSEGARLTVSWGIASWPADGDSHEILMHVADARLFDMKRLKNVSRAPTASAWAGAVSA
jgi:diguanylate cyclase (GGDEF)-like protein